MTRKSSRAALSIVIVFFSAMTLSVLSGKLPLLILVGYSGLSLITFAAYAMDKSAARRGAWRIRERSLLVLGLVGGWPGALVAQQTLRHKSKKTAFRIAFWATVILNCALLICLQLGGALELGLL